MILLQRYRTELSGVTDARCKDDPPSIRRNFTSAVHPEMVTCVDYRTDARCTFVQMPGWWLYVATPVGLECYPNLTTLLDTASTLGRQATVKRLEDLRLLAFVVFCEATDEVLFGRSLDGFGSMFYAGAGRDLLVSDSRFDVARQSGAVKLSCVDEAVWCAKAALDPEGSFLIGVKRCFAGCLYRCSPDDSKVPHRHLMAPEGKILSEAEAMQVLHDGLMAIFATYGNRRIALRLSGGVDSRVVLTGLLEAVRIGILRKEQILCTSVLFHGLECDESAEIRQIIAIAGFEWVGIDATQENVDLAYAQGLQLPAPPFPTSFIGALCMEEARARGVQIMISGHGGDEIFDFDLTDVLDCSPGERIRRTWMVRLLRAPTGLVDECKSLASIIFGRQAMRSIMSVLTSSGLARDSRRAHRIGRRVALACGCGYENSACHAAMIGMFIDVPLLRAPFFSRFAPMDWTLLSDDSFKSLAFAFMDKWAPELSAIPTRKVSFSSAIEGKILAETRNCDTLDARSAHGYSTTRAFVDWRSNVAVKGIESHESLG